MKSLYFKLAIVIAQSNRIILNEQRLPREIYTFNKLDIDIYSDLAQPQFKLLFTTCDLNLLTPEKFSSSLFRPGFFAKKINAEPLYKIIVFDSASNEWAASNKSYKVKGMIKYDQSLRSKRTIAKGEDVEVIHYGLLPSRNYTIGLYKYDKNKHQELQSMAITQGQRTGMVIKENIVTGECYFFKTLDTLDTRIVAKTQCMTGNFEYSMSSVLCTNLAPNNIRVTVNTKGTQPGNDYDLLFLQKNGIGLLSNTSMRIVEPDQSISFIYDNGLTQGQTYRFVLVHKLHSIRKSQYELELPLRDSKKPCFDMQTSKESWSYFD